MDMDTPPAPAGPDGFPEHQHRLAEDLLNVILPIGIALSGESDFDRLLELILTQAKRLCHADGGTLYLRTGEELTFATLVNDSLGLAAGGTTGRPIALPPVKLRDDATGEPNYHNVASSAVLNAHSINIPDIYHDPNFDFSGTREFDRRNGYRSVSSLTIPLKDREGTVTGVLQLLNAQDSATGAIVPFDDYMQQVTEALASQAAVVLNNRLLLKRQEELLRFEQELRIGQQMQASFLPDQLPQPPGWELVGLCQPAREVAGDFYDAFLLDDDRVVLVMADVCGKGVGAALFMALIRTLIRAFADLYGQAEAADAHWLVRPLERTNAYLLRNHADAAMFATLFFGVLDLRSATLTYVNAGHEAPLVVGAEGVRARLESGSAAVGMLPGTVFRPETLQMEPGDALVAFTDGLTEAINAAQDAYGEERLDAMLATPAESAAALSVRIVGDVNGFVGSAEQADDLTLLVVRRG